MRDSANEIRHKQHGNRKTISSRLRRHRVRRFRHDRRGSILIVVLVLVMLLTFAVYGFTRRMLTENRAAVAYGNAAKAAASAASGIELAAAAVSQRELNPASPILLYHRPSLFAGVVMGSSADPASVPRFTLVSPIPGSGTAGMVRYGLVDESSKLNINAIVAPASSSSSSGSTSSSSGTTGSTSSGQSSQQGSSSGAGQSGQGASSSQNAGSAATGQTGSGASSSGSSSSSQSGSSSSSGSSSQSSGSANSDLQKQAKRLINLPGMTDELADAILDYIDADDTVRSFGAESAYYQGLAMPYPAKNGPLESLDELLMVRGVSPMLLYGEDANRNGLLDPNENDGLASPPGDNADGALLLGWTQYLTVYSRESNTLPDGSEKIFINQGILTDLYDETMKLVNNEDKAKFIVAYRMYGPVETEEDEEGSGDQTSGGASGGNNAAASSQSTNGTPSAGQAAEALDRLAGNLANAISSSDGDSSVTRGGLDLTPGPKVKINSLYDLFDCEVEVAANEDAGTDAQTLTSPWSSASILTEYPKLVNLFSLTEKKVIKGRINVNQAPYGVLIGIPSITESLAQTIIAGRPSPGGGMAPSHRTTAWLVAENLVNLETMRKLDPYLTGRGDVFRVQSVGFFSGGGPQARIEALIDGTVYPARVLMFRDLTELGPGYLPSQLIPGGS